MVAAAAGRVDIDLELGDAWRKGVFIGAGVDLPPIGETRVGIGRIILIEGPGVLGLGDRGSDTVRIEPDILPAAACGRTPDPIVKAEPVRLARGLTVFLFVRIDGMWL